MQILDSFKTRDHPETWPACLTENDPDLWLLCAGELTPTTNFTRPNQTRTYPRNY